MKNKFGIGMMLLVMLLVSLVFVPAVSAMSAGAASANEKSANSYKAMLLPPQSNSGTDTARYNMLGSYVYGKTYFHGTLVTGLTIPVTFTGDGYTYGKWYGSGLPAKIRLDSSVTIYGLSISLSYPLSAGFSRSGNTVSYSGEWTNTRSATHSYSDLVAKSWIQINGQTQSDAETFRFSNMEHTLYTLVDL